MVEVPCKDDPSQMCEVPCAGSNNAVGGVSTTGSGGAGAAATGAGAAPVDVSGDVVQFTTTVFDTTIGYPEEATVLAPGVDTQTVVAEAVGGA
ncbi:MAG: hypothetical protein R3F14_27250 [Polyangiaceae bacterium]